MKNPDHRSGASQVLALVMLAPRSYTAEDVVELHCHGGAVCARRVLACCLAAGARLARPGEFTLRAFLNGRLDLTQVNPFCYATQRSCTLLLPLVHPCRSSLHVQSQHHCVPVPSE